MMKRAKWIVIFLTVFIQCCICLSPISAWSEGENPQVVSIIAVMPFFRGEDPSNREAVLSCTMDQFCPDEVDVIPGGEDMLTSLVWKAMNLQYDDRVVSRKNAREVYSQINTLGIHDTPRALAMHFGQKLEASHVIVGNVWRIREKAIEEQQPASVSFSIYLIDVATGRRMWRTRYDKSQQPLTENLLKTGDFIKQGGRWLTARELASLGIKEAMERFPLRDEY